MLSMSPGEEPIPGYRLVRHLGEGGFGTVWEAEAPGGIRIALKFVRLDTEHAGPELRAMEVIKNVRHPHLLDLHFAMQLEGWLVLAMPLCDQSLKDRLQACQAKGLPGLPRDELLGVMEELAQAVDFLNEHRHQTEGGGLVSIQHRDIKPQNVFLIGGSARLADFGLAKIIEATRADHSGCMSPHYVAPEVLDGTVTPWSDQYSLAVTFYQLRTGMLPFSGTMSQVLLGHLHEPPDLSGLLPEEREITGRALAKRPEERWPTCREFVRRLAEAMPTETWQGATLPPTLTLQGQPMNLMDPGRHNGTSTLVAAQGIDRWGPVSSSPTAPDPAPGVGPVEGRKSRRVGLLALIAVPACLAGVLFVASRWREPTPTPVPPPPRTETVRIEASPPSDRTPPKSDEVANSAPLSPGTKPSGTDREPLLTKGEPGQPPAREEAPAKSEKNAGPGDLAARTAEVRRIFQTHCLDCHGGKKTKGGVKILDRDLLVKKEMLVPGQPDESELFLLVTATDETVMPPPDQPRLSSAEIDAIRGWIAAGAPALPAVGPEPTKPDQAVAEAVPKAGTEVILKAILEDVRKLPVSDRPSARYLSLNHLLVDGVDAEALQVERDALAKAINHLTWERDLVRPQPIDPSGTVFRIDLRTLGWDQKPYQRIEDDKEAGPSRLNLFDLVLLEYPYGVVSDDSETYDQLVAEFLTPAGQVRPIPFVRADWFVSTATLPPLYEDLLMLPRSLKELEKRLGVDLTANQDDGRARRAAMTVSDVSRNNRAVERHPARYGAYWLSFDFRTSKADQNLFRDPIHLNPAGGEVIFNLPNGLQGYVLADAKGNRLDVAPTEIVTDKFAEDRTVRNGLSCMRCHDAGMKTFVDAVRPVLERLPGNPGFDRKQALRLYPGQAEMDGLLKKDADRFLAAEREIFDKVPLKEPLIPVTKRFLEEPLSLATAAAELGTSSPAELRAVFRTPAFTALGLAALASDGSVRRDTWEDDYDRVVRSLGLGTPILPLDGLTRRDVRPTAAEFDLSLGTNQKNNVFAPGDELVIVAANSSQKDYNIEMIGTSAQGRKVILAPSTTVVRAGEKFRFPETGAITVQAGQGKEQITVFASDVPFPPGELLRGGDVVDRVVHRFDDSRGKFDPARMIKKTIEVETQSTNPL